MTPMDAVNLLDSIVAQVAMNRPQHIEALRASATLRRALAPKLAEVPHGDNA